MTVRYLMAILATALVLAGCSGTSDTATSLWPSGAGGAEPGTETDAPGFDLGAVVESFVGDSAGGAAVLIVRNGTATTAAAGVADSSGTPLTPESVFRVGSISKPFIATMVMQLVDEGLVDLDRTLGEYLPDTPLGASLEIRLLLGHQSGIPNYTDQREFFPDVLADLTRTYRNDEVLDFVVDVGPGPLNQFAYSNTNYVLLGQLVEAIDGTGLNESLRARITAPLGLDATAFVGRGVKAPDGLVAGWSPGVFAGETDVAYESIASSAWAAGALVSNLEDLARFLEALFGGELVSTDSLTEMTDTAATGYGLGLLEAQLGVGNPGYAHNGGIPGFSSTMGIAPESGDLLVILTNNDALVADLLAPRILMQW